jgi:demethylmenaquinone methyltransferase/2-methoxy-6-polyprenyl-1,4-benzoquinol methylase
MDPRPHGHGPDRAAALAQYRRRADHYDLEVAVFEPVRELAVDALRLHAGATVLDVGCGTGLSFPLLRQRIGPQGRIVGIEQSPDMLAKARERIALEQWDHVRLVCAPACAAAIPVRADAALFHLTHDILRDDAAIANVLAHLKPGARVVASGLRWAPAWMWPTNVFVMAAALYSATSLDGLGQAWDKLAAHLRRVQVHTTLLGGMFIASGVYAPQVH